MHFDDLVDGLASSKLDPVELVEGALERADRSQHVFIEIFRDRALADARAAYCRWREGCPLSRLDGIPIAWKDIFDIKGAINTAGSPTRAGLPPATRDACVLANARKLGIVAIGKTNLSEFAYSGLGLNPHFGTPTADFPTSLPRVPGGSSSGSAIAVQRNIVPGAVGTDTAGSIRIPAAFNGLVGFRPSLSRYPNGGTYQLSARLDTIGPLARSARDCAWMDRALMGSVDQPEDPCPLSELRFVMDQYYADDPGISDVVRENLSNLVERLRSAGAHVQTRPVQALAATRRLIRDTGWLGAVDILERHLPVLAGPQRSLVDPCITARLEKAHSISAEARKIIDDAYERFPRDLENEMGNAIVMTPTSPFVAPELGPLEADPDLFAEVNLDALSITMVGSFLRMPGVALPSGTDRQGLPTSVLFSARQGLDDLLLRAAMAVELTLGA